ncbi:MAG: hypothetical protein WC145_12250 [Aliarcobacter sp.]
MKFEFTNLDDPTRKLMQEEIARAAENDEIYFSARFNTIGSSQWVAWLTEAAESHDEHWLAYQIEVSGGMKDFEGRAKPTGGYTVAHVPHTAAETLAEGQFNRFYIAGVCRRSVDAGQSNVTIYRARHRGEPRPESKALEGTATDAQALLEQVRSKQASFGCPMLKPNSGLSVQL